jgi:parvulin-like peptidyl-prolyl isomerase
VAKEFTDQDEVNFRLIKVDLHGGKAFARQRAEEILAKTKTADFAEIARSPKMNDDARLARAGGEEAPLQRGAYRLEKVEAMLWNTPVGQITPIIEDAGGFYIAKVESRKLGKTLPFDDQDVQDRIYKGFWSRQFRSLTEQIEQNLRKNSMVRESPEMQQIAVEMAMQNYVLWSKSRGPVE